MMLHILTICSKATGEIKNILFSGFVLWAAFSCEKKDKGEQEKYPNQNLVDYTVFVDPMIGTKKMGHVYPGATVPFGMVQLSPETNSQPMYIDGQYNRKTYEYCAGYQYKDSTIFGFSHTHFSGTGHSDLGDFLVMPTTGPINLEPGRSDESHSGYHSKFSHQNETASPGYYQVKLEDYDIDVALTATERTGFHKYTFPDDRQAHVILDLMANIYQHEDKNVWTFIRVENDTLVTGYRQTQGWARTRKVFFAMTFSQPIIKYGHKKYDGTQYNGFYRRFDEETNFPEMAGKNIRAYFDFDARKNPEVKMKLALSAVSTSGALKNLQTEIPDWNFDKVRQDAKEKWNQELAKIDIETTTPKQKVSFYTALYHTMLSPTLYEDVDGNYRGLDQNIYTSNGFTNYTTFSLWDTYRALHPLFNIIQQERNNDMVKSMLAHHDQSVHHMLPIWSHYANENWCMIGYHAAAVLADAIVKGTTDIDIHQALAACVSTSNVDYFDGIESYKALGYVPEDVSNSSVSKTLEFAYDDWTIAQIAKKAGKDSLYKAYLTRSGYYKNNYDTTIRYMRPRLSNGQWKTKFDPLDTHGQGFIEGNAWNYGLYVPQDLPNMIKIMGGKDAFALHLDSLFEIELDNRYIEKNEDITRDGIIGSYVHGNEPGHHIPYLYNWTNQAWKTQSRVRMIMDQMYGTGPDGLCGNDDAGQMSAWYIFSALGFYPVCPGSPTYAIGSPMVKQATVNLENGKKILIKTVNQGLNNVYVEKLTINGEEVKRNYLQHDDFSRGGTLTFYLSDQPNKSPTNP